GRKQGGPSSTGGRAAGKVVPLKEGAEMIRSTLDDTDLAILRALQANARATYTEIGRAVGLSAPSVHDRVQRLEQRGVIRGYRAELDPDAVGLTVLSLGSVLPSANANALARAGALAPSGLLRGCGAELYADAVGLTVLSLVSVLPSDNANALAMAEAFAHIAHV